MTTNAASVASQAENRGVSSLTIWLSRLCMGLPMLLLSLIGFRYITNPTHAASPTGVTLSTPEALTDTRVVGALALTIVFTLAGCFVSRKLRMGHAIVIAMMAFILAVRMFGFAKDGTTLAMGDQKVKTTGEVVLLLLNAIGYFLQRYPVKPTLEQR